jgi:hypothetical protein
MMLLVMFQLHAFVLYTISDYPQLGVVLGYSVHGENGYVACREETWSIRLKHGLKFKSYRHHQNKEKSFMKISCSSNIL